MASSNQVPKLYMAVIEDVISEVHKIFLNDGVDEQVLKELKTLWENKLMQSKAVEGFHNEMQQAAAMQAAQQQHQQQIHHQQYAQPAQAQAAPPVMGFWYGGTPYQQLISNQGQLMQVIRGPNGAQYIIQQPPQQIMLQQQMHPGGAQAPVMQHVLPQQTRVMGQPQQIVFAPGNRAGVQVSNAQVMPGHAAAQVQQIQQGPSAAAPQAPRQPQALQAQQHLQPQQHQQAQQPHLQPQQPLQAQQPQQHQQQSPPVFLQLDGAGNNTSSEEDEDDEEEDDDEDEDDEEEGKDRGEEGKDGEHGQAEEEEPPLNSEDDLSDEDQDQFDTEYVVVCQYDKIHRTKNKWKFQLKDGIMNLNGRDYVFSKAIGDAEW